MLGILSVQVGAAFAKTLFPVLGPYGTVFLRLFFAALILMVAGDRGYADTGRVSCAGIVLWIDLQAMNMSFYAALERLPLGVAVTVSFVGPLSVACSAPEGCLTCCGRDWLREGSCSLPSPE